ncbi:MAG: glycoside hydrolase family 3 C-terminal domain-containing protein [Ilumatobacteraceae bacterium]
MDLVATMPLEDKVQLLTGRDFWSTWPNDEIGLRSIVLSDGPSGVRGPVWDERSPSLNLPSATALSSSWDVDVAYRYGTCSASEARRKGVDVVLGPTINLHRSPLGGRHFEAFSEDPILTADMAAAYVRGVQDNGVGATPKHYVANDSETERFTVDVQVSDRALREVYLLAFERAITESQAWLVMSAYNSINGATATENELLETPLNSEWGFDGVVVSDWTAVRTLRSAEFSQDLVMPGPRGPWGDKLVGAVRDGTIDEAVVDRKVGRILALAARVGALDSFGPPATPADVDGRAVAREAATEGMVLVRNDGLLPLDAVESIAVIGYNAKHARTQGGGSATVIPEAVVSPLDGIRAAYPNAEVTYSPGPIVHEGVAEFAPDSMTNPSTGGPGALVRMLDETGAAIHTEDRFASALVYFGGDAPVGDMATFEFSTRWVPDETGPIRIGCATVGDIRIHVDGRLVGEVAAHPVGDDLGAAFLSPPPATVPVDVVAGQAVDLTIELTPMKAFRNALSITVGTESAVTDADELIADAVAVAGAASVAVVVVGTNSKVESEGYDRSSLGLPGQQNALVDAVVAANPQTIVIVNSGSPVELPWRDRVPAVLLSWFGGQEYGAAIGDVLTGIAEPGGRLPTTWPAEMADAPVLEVTPDDGVLVYDEGIHIGYRAWLRSERTPAFEFGSGLGYTTWQVDAPDIDDDGETITLSVPVTNTGDRSGKSVVQVYASRPDSSVDRPVNWLVGFAVVRSAPGERAVAPISIPRRRLAHWDGTWTIEPGTFTLHVATSVSDIHHRTDVTIA